MDNLIVLILCLVAGMVLGRTKIFPANASETINHIIIYICLPALSLLYIPQVKINLQTLFPVGVVYIIFFFSFIFISAAGKIFKLDRKTIGALILTCGLANTSFVGFPILRMLYGEESLKTGIIIDQSGSFIVVSTLGILVASYYSSSKPNAKEIILRILKFPPFFAFVIALMLIAFNYSHPPVVANVLEKTGSPIFLLAIFSVGLQLKLEFKEIKFIPVASGLLYKLFLAPLIIYVFYVLLLKGSGESIQVCIIESAMGPMVTGAILATNYDLNPRLVSFITGFGIILSFITVLLWYNFIKSI